MHFNNSSYFPIPNNNFFIPLELVQQTEEKKTKLKYKRLLLSSYRLRGEPSDALNTTNDKQKPMA